MRKYRKRLAKHIDRSIFFAIKCTYMHLHYDITYSRLVRQPVRIVWKFISGLVGGTSRLIPDCFPVKKSRKNRKWPFWGLSGHLLSRYIVHLGLKNTPGLIFEVPGPQNPVKKLILNVFSKIRRRFSGRAAGQVCFILVQEEDFLSCLHALVFTTESKEREGP